MRIQPLFPLTYLCFGVFIYAFFQLLLLGVAEIGGSSEAREAKVISVIVSENEWVLPLRNGIVPSKPPFFHWCGAALQKLFSTGSDVNEFSSRLPSLLFSFGVLIIVAGIGYRLALFHGGEVGSQANLVALTGSAVLALTYGFHLMAIQSMVDMSFCFFVTLALLAPLFGSIEGVSFVIPPYARALFWFSCSGAVIARGPIGIVLPLYLVFVGGAFLAGLKVTFKELTRFSFGWFFFLVPLLWYVAAYKSGGVAFVNRQLLFENVTRVLGGEHVNGEPFWFYFPSILRTTFPWAVIVLIALYKREAINIGRTQVTRLASRRVFYLPALLTLAGILFFSIPAGKRHSYLLPCYGFVAVQAALLFVEGFVNSSVNGRRELVVSLQRVCIILTSISFLLLLFIGLLSSGFGLSYLPSNALLKVSFLAPVINRAASPVGLVLLCAITPIFLPIKDSIGKLLLKSWVLGIAVLFTCICLGLSVKGYSKGFSSMALSVLDKVGPNEEIVVVKKEYDEYFDPLMYYLKRPVLILKLPNLSPDTSPSPTGVCKSNALYLVRRSEIFRLEGAVSGSFSEVESYQERWNSFAEVHHLRSSHKNDLKELVSLRCTTTTNTQPGATIGDSAATA